ncbi:unnamed protein product [Caenorhabditis nigoni]
MVPSLVKLKLSNETSLKVLGNQLIMGKLLKCSNAFDIVRAEDVMEVLPHLDPKSLENLEINDPPYEYRRLYDSIDYPNALKIPYDIEEMAKTEQWNSLKKLEVRSELISTPIQKMNLTNLSNIYITTVARITSSDVIFLKENLLTPKLEKFIICFKDFVEDPQLNHFFGPPRNTFGTRRLWCFPIPGTNRKLMEIDLSENLCLKTVCSYWYS